MQGMARKEMKEGHEGECSVVVISAKIHSKLLRSQEFVIT